MNNNMYVSTAADASTIDYFLKKVLKLRNSNVRKSFTDELTDKWSQECHHYGYDITNFIQTLQTRLSGI